MADPAITTVLVTRPVGQEGPLMEQLEQAGFKTVHLPTLWIEPCPLTPAQRNLLANVDLYRAVFFASVNAVKLALPVLEDYWPQWPLGVHWLAVGTATARLLIAAGMVVECPATGMDSEAVLELPGLQDIQGQRVLLCRGEGGRSFLRQQLEARGAEVEVLSLYRRCPVADWRWPDADAVLVNSVDSWQAMAPQVPPSAWVVAASGRIAEVVRESHDRVGVAASALDTDMVAALVQARGRHPVEKES